MAARSAMGRDIRTRRERWKAWWGRRTRVGKITLWMLAAIFLCTFGLMVHVATTLDTIVITLAGMAITPLVLILLFRWFTYTVLWRVRNRLILTYLLMGLAPLVMFVTLASIAGYLLAGQYATNVGLSRLTEGLTRVRDEAGSAAVFGTRDDAQLARAAGFTPTKKNLAVLGGTASSGSTASSSALAGMGGTEIEDAS